MRRGYGEVGSGPEGAPTAPGQLLRPGNHSRPLLSPGDHQSFLQETELAHGLRHHSVFASFQLPSSNTTPSRPRIIVSWSAAGAPRWSSAMTSRWWPRAAG